MRVHIFGHRKETTEELLVTGVAGIDFGRTIEFSSGILSPGCYMNCRALPSYDYPALWHRCINGIHHTIAKLEGFPEFDTIASVENGAVPHGSTLAFVMRKPHVSVAKEAKRHGKDGFIQGNLRAVRGKRVLVVEDVSTTGESALKAVRKLVDQEAEVVGVLALATYGFPELLDTANKFNMPFFVKGHFGWIFEHLLGEGKIDSTHEEIIREWLKNPRMPWSWPTRTV